MGGKEVGLQCLYSHGSTLKGYTEKQIAQTRHDKAYGSIRPSLLHKLVLKLK